MSYHDDLDDGVEGRSVYRAEIRCSSLWYSASLTATAVVQ